MVGDLVISVVGAFIAGWLLPKLNIYIGGSIVGDIINAVIGAVVLLLVLRVLRRAPEVKRRDEARRGTATGGQ